MGYIRNNGVVRFSYGRDELLEACTLKSSYLSRSVKDGDGGYAGEDLVLTEDEADAFGECLAGCVNELWGLVAKLCPPGADTFSVEEEVTLSLNDGGCDGRTLAVVDADLREALVYGVMKGWMLLCGEVKLSEACSQMFGSRMEVLWRDMFRMRNRVLE